jgi:hypothetical protein
MSLDEVAAAVADHLGLEGTAEEIQHLVEAVVAIDGVVKGLAEQVESLRAANELLAQSKVNSVKSALADRVGWTEQLYAASKHGELEPTEGGESTEPHEVMSKEEVVAGGGPATIIRNQQRQAG